MRSNRYLSIVDRQRIADLRRQGLSIREIARRLERSLSTVSRELRRNTAEHDVDYDAVLAHLRARERGARPGRSRLARDPELRATVQEKLELEWGPEQIEPTYEPLIQIGRVCMSVTSRSIRSPIAVRVAG